MHNVTIVFPYSAGDVRCLHTLTFFILQNCDIKFNIICMTKPLLTVCILFPADPPKNTSVLARPSSVVDAGRPLTLTCSSQANPAVDNFTWHRLTLDGGSVQC